jgi:hypothetical protein
MNVLPPAGPQRRRQLVVLALAVVVLAALVWHQVGPTPAVTGVPASNTKTPRAAAAGPAILPEPVRLAALGAAGEAPAAGRNPFRFGAHPPPPAPPAAKRPPPPPPAPPPPPPAPQVPLRLTILTTLPGGQRAAQLKDPSGAVFVAVEGQIIDGRYRLLKIGNMSVVVSFLDGSGQRTIPLNGGG